MWIIHWAIQGLKLWFFAIIALIAATIACFPFALVESGLKKLLEPGQFMSVVSVIFAGLYLTVSLAVGTAVLARMLNEHPFLPFKLKQPSQSNNANRTSRTTTAAQPASSHFVLF